MSEVKQSLIDQWKREYGKIFSASFGDVEFIFRIITFAEYKAVYSQELSSAESEEEIIKAAVLSPKEYDLDHAPAGSVSMLADEILSNSGFGSVADLRGLIEAQREEITKVHDLMKAYIIAAMPAYKLHDLEDLTMEELTYMLAISEKILEISVESANGVVKLEFTDPEEEAEKQQQEANKHAAQKKGGTAGLNDPIAQQLHQSLG